jgi:hypothetical protein
LALKNFINNRQQITGRHLKFRIVLFFLSEPVDQIHEIDGVHTDQLVFQGVHIHKIQLTDLHADFEHLAGIDFPSSADEFSEPEYRADRIFAAGIDQGFIDYALIDLCWDAQKIIPMVVIGFGVGKIIGIMDLVRLSVKTDNNLDTIG